MTKTDEQRSPKDENLQQLRRELLEQIVRNEARRRTARNAAVGSSHETWDYPTNTGEPNA